MAERSVREGEEQIANQIGKIEELDRKGNHFAASRAKKLLADFENDLKLARADLRAVRSSAQSRRKKAG
jgi:hypothetical protein